MVVRTGRSVKMISRSERFVRLSLRWPPSVNKYWRHARGRTYISAPGRAYRAEVAHAIIKAGSPSFGTERLSVSIRAYQPDLRRRDIDNILKSLLDALESAGLFDDDEQIDHLAVWKYPPGELPKTRGMIHITIEVIEPEQADA